MIHNEDTRVKIPSIIHLTKLGYQYLSLKNEVWDKSTNIFTNIFNTSIASINPELTEKEIQRLYDEVSLSLENEDLGKVFFEKLINRNGVKLIDFENFENNSFNVVTELPCKKDDEEFRPDITILINGMPLIFIEVKKPNNRDGILAEHKRMGERFSNKKFRKFVNITQMMIFSNNMEYDDASPETIEGAFYASTAYRKPIFNYFREEDDTIYNGLAPLQDDVENFVLKDALNQHIFKVTSETQHRTFCYFELLQYLKHFKMMAELRKTTMGHITTEHLKQSRISIPPTQLVDELHRVLNPSIEIIIKNSEENKKLTELRDWLLPMLMNGQVSVGEV